MAFGFRDAVLSFLNSFRHKTVITTSMTMIRTQRVIMRATRVIIHLWVLSLLLLKESVVIVLVAVELRETRVGIEGLRGN